MPSHRCPHVRTVQKRLRELYELARDLPEEYAGLRTALGRMATDSDALLGSCARTGGADDPGARGASAPDIVGVQDAPVGRLLCPLDAREIYQTMLDQSHAQIAYMDSQFNFMAVNAAYARGSGYAREYLIGRNHFDLFPHAENQAIFTQARDSGEVVSFTAKPFVFANRPELGTTYWDWILAPDKGAEGATRGLTLSLTDVTPREVARQALAESEERYRVLVDTMAEGLASLDMDGSLTFVNDEFCQMLGYSRDELIGRHHLEVVHAQQHQRHTEELGKRISGQPATFETVLARRDGSGLPVILAGRPLRDREGRICGTLAAFTDISARKKAELALNAERDFVSAVLDTTAVLVVVLDRQGRIVRFNRACEKLTGYAYVEVKGKPFWDLFLIPEELEAVQATFEELRAGQFLSQRENYWVTKDGTRRLIAWSNTAILDAEGAVQHIVSTGYDVTDARLAEEAVRSTAKFPSENPHPVLRISCDGVILYANEASRGLLAMWATRVGHPLPASWSALATEVLTSSRRRTIETLCGEILYSVDFMPIAQEGYVNLYARDITEQARAQTALRLARDELETHVQERTRELETANRALEALSQSDRRQRLAAEGLLQATLALNSSLDLDEVLDRILEQTQFAIHCQAVTVIPASEETVHIAKQRGLDPLVVSGQPLTTVLPLETLYGAGAPNESRKTVSISGTLLDGQGAGPFGLAWVRSYVATPLQVEQRLIGSLCAFSDQADAFSHETLRLAEGFAAHAATAIHNAALYKAALHARGLAEELAAASAALTQTLDLESVMNALLDYLLRMVPYDGATIALVRDKNRLALRAVRG
jgi:PAS domain S-box-containing protein